MIEENVLYTMIIKVKFLHSFRFLVSMYNMLVSGASFSIMTAKRNINIINIRYSGGILCVVRVSTNNYWQPDG